jgi:predicted amidophosphoribosyltransferase
MSDWKAHEKSYKFTQRRWKDSFITHLSSQTLLLINHPTYQYVTPIMLHQKGMDTEASYAHVSEKTPYAWKLTRVSAPSQVSGSHSKSSEVTNNTFFGKAQSKKDQAVIASLEESSDTQMAETLEGGGTMQHFTKP